MGQNDRRKIIQQVRGASQLWVSPPTIVIEKNKLQKVTERLVTGTIIDGISAKWQTIIEVEQSAPTVNLLTVYIEAKDPLQVSVRIIWPPDERWR